MEVDESLVTFIATTYYNITPTLGSIQTLCGYTDKNFTLVDSNDHRKYVLKIVGPKDSSPLLIDVIDEIVDNAHQFCDAESGSLQFLVPKLIRTSANKLSAYTSVKFNRNDGTNEDMVVKCNLKMTDYFESITMFDYINNCSTQYKPEKLYFQLGRVSNQLFRFFRTQGHLQDSLSKIRRETSFIWQLVNNENSVEQSLNELYPEANRMETAIGRRRSVEQVLEEYREIKHQLNRLPQYIFHSDLCNKNILIDLQNRDKLCLIDFQDIQVGPQVGELAILMLYNVLEQERFPYEKALKWIPYWIYKGYQSASSTIYRLSHEEMIFAPILMKFRLCQSLLQGQLAFKENPDNEYVMQTNQRGWQLLDLMTTNNDRYYYGDSINEQLVSWWINGLEGTAMES